MPNESAVTGLEKSLTTEFAFDPQNYEVTVNGGTASQFKEEEVTIVTITASVPIGKQFKEWTVVSGGVTLANPKAASTTFTMPANAVEITATYEDIPAGVSVSTAAELKTALAETTSQTINVTADITFTETITQGADPYASDPKRQNSHRFRYIEPYWHWQSYADHERRRNLCLQS